LKILVVSAHPDDETIGMGGTLKKLSKSHEISILFLSEGITSRRTSGYKNAPKYEVTSIEEKKMKKEIEIRKKHAKKALKIIGVKKMRFLDYRNLEMDQIPLLKVVKEIEKEISKTNCEVIFTHHFNDLNIDHRIAFEATVTAARPIPKSKISQILSFEIPASTNWRYPYEFKPNMFVNIKNELKFKLRALAEYKNEIRKFPNPRSKKTTVAIAQRWGSLSGFEAAEAFEIVFSKLDYKKNPLS